MDASTDEALDELGPVDYLVVEFPAGAQHFTGEMADELALAASRHHPDPRPARPRKERGRSGRRVRDRRPRGPDAIRALEADIAEILAADDVDHLAAAMEPGSVAGVVVWENRWAAPFATAARRAGGQLIATGRIPIQAIAASIEAEASPDKGSSSGSVCEA